MIDVWVEDSKLNVCEEERQAVLDYQCKDNKMIDIFVGVIEGLSSYLVLAKKIKKEQKRVCFIGILKNKLKSIGIHYFG